LTNNYPNFIIGYHSCDKEVGLKVLNGKEDLIKSNNQWDWLGEGVYFWEQNPFRGLDYSLEVAKGKQFNKKKITTPFVLGAIIELGNCLNLLEPKSIDILKESYFGFCNFCNKTNSIIPKNIGNNRALDCAVIRYTHQSFVQKNKLPYDTVRSTFNEGKEIYEGSAFTTRNHIQVCVTNLSMIKGYFLPRPIDTFNPYLDK
jgi:hypothetical protein